MNKEENITNPFWNKRYLTCAVADRIPRDLQIALWDMIDTAPFPLASFQYFNLYADCNMQIIEQEQHFPDNQRTIKIDTNGKYKPIAEQVYVYDNGTSTVMSLREEWG